MSEVSPRVEEILYSAGKTSGCSGGRFVRIEDADSASPAPEMLKTVVRANQNYAGIYGAVIRTGQVLTGQAIFVRAATPKVERR
jgi:hypothetical protein